MICLENMSDLESSDPEDMVASDDEEVAPATSFDIEMQVRLFIAILSIDSRL